MTFSATALMVFASIFCLKVWVTTRRTNSSASSCFVMAPLQYRREEDEGEGDCGDHDAHEDTRKPAIEETPGITICPVRFRDPMLHHICSCVFIQLFQERYIMHMIYLSKKSSPRSRARMMSIHFTSSLIRDLMALSAFLMAYLNIFSMSRHSVR